MEIFGRWGRVEESVAGVDLIACFVDEVAMSFCDNN